jgi:tetratricopeptide (TPR) repeat protein
MICPRIALLSLSALLTANASVMAVNKEKLRRAACLPLLTACSSFQFHSATGFSLGPKTPLPEEIAAVRELLKSDPTNAENYIRLGSLYDKAGSQSESKEAYSQAAELCRRQLEQHPDDLSWRLTLAEALQDLGKDDEAESLIRQALKDAPRDWRCWLELAEVLGTKSLNIIMNNKPFHYDSPETLLQAIRAAQPTTETFAAAQPYRKEAAACFDEAIALAPREPKINQRRFGYRQSYRAISCGFRMYKGEKVNSAEIYLLQPDELEDLRRVADLNGDDYVAIGGATFFEVFPVVIEYQLHHPFSKPPAKIIDELPEATRKRLFDNLNRLEKGMNDPDEYKAAIAAMSLGTLQGTILEDKRAAEKSLRRCLELDPERDDAWDMLIAMFELTKRYSDALEFSRRRVKQKDSAHNRLFLARAYEYVDRLDKAGDEIRAGLRLAPDDFMLNVALADMLLMRGQPNDLKKTGELLCIAAKNHDREAPGENRWINYTYACGIFYGLKGDVKQARQCLLAVQRRGPEGLFTKEALQALDETGNPIIDGWKRFTEMIRIPH